MDQKELLGLIATLIAFAGYAPYVWGMYKGRVKPHAFSWTIWGLLTFIGFFAQVTGNAGPGAWVTLVSAVITSGIAFIAFFKFDRSYITRSDWITFIAALAAIPLWLITENPLYSVIWITIIDAIGFYPTFRKGWHKPYEELLLQFFLAGLKFAISLFALTSFTTITVLYPASLVIMNWLFIAMVLVRRKNYFAKP